MNGPGAAVLDAKRVGGENLRFALHVGPRVSLSRSGVPCLRVDNNLQIVYWHSRVTPPYFRGFILSLGWATTTTQNFLRKFRRVKIF
jgi:hypothetical protein